MAFVNQICSPPYNFDLLEDEEGGHSAWFLIGHDDARPVTYFAVATLSPYDEGCPEFSFSVAENDVETGTQRHYHSGRGTAGMFSSLERHLVLDVVLQATFALLRWRRPVKVHRCTRDPFPPERALRKHELVSWVFQQAGYTILRYDQWHGQMMWTAVLDPARG
jgi:hypothetical protein